MEASSNKAVGIFIPDDCKHITVFDTEESFMEAINSGQMTPLYGVQEHEKEHLPVFIAYTPTSNH